MRLGDTDNSSGIAPTAGTRIRRWRGVDRRADITFGIILVALIGVAIGWATSIRDCKSEADRRRPANWNEARYAKRNPEVKKDIAIGIYSNPYQKYYCEVVSRQ